MSAGRMLRAVGLVGMSSSVVWTVALIVEYQFGLRPPGDGRVAYEADQAAFFLAQVGFLGVIAGLYRARAGGDGRFGRVAIGIWLIGMVAIVLGQGLGLMSINAIFLLPVAGIGQTIGAVLTSVAVWRARRWTGWRRLAPAIWTAYLFFTIASVIAAVPVLTIPAAAPSPRAPSPVLEGLLQGAWLLLSLALYIEAGRQRDIDESASRGSLAGLNATGVPSGPTGHLPGERGDKGTATAGPLDC
jgi:hypothetical protein